MFMLKSKIMIDTKNRFDKTIILMLTGLLGLLASPVWSQVNPPAGKKPNIVFIVVDDLGWGELGSYGNTFNETPHLDRLAAAGKRFTQAYAAAPVCSPTRASFMTGQYPARVGITDFLPEGWKTERFLDPKLYVTLNEALAEKGYHSAIVGKWHLDTRFKRHTGSPQLHGFNEVIGSETEYIAGGDYFFPYEKINTYKTGSSHEYLTDRQSSDACDFIRRNNNKPFFLYLSYYSVHTRLAAPKYTVDKYKNKFNKKYGRGRADKLFEKDLQHEADHLDNPYLAAMLEHIDNGVGMVMQTLKEQHLLDNTIIIFTSDNGGAEKVANNGNLRGYKTWLYEGGIRVPLLIHWPAHIQPATVEDPASSIDIYPTLVEATGGNASTYNVDGQSLLPLLVNGRPLKQRALYWHYPSETLKWTEKIATAVRKENYKLIQFYIDNRYELYDLEKDSSETMNLASKETRKVEELSTLLNNWKKEVNAEAPDTAAISKANALPAQQAQRKTAELTKDLGLSDDQSQKMYNMFLAFFKENEAIRKTQMRSDEQKQAREHNNKMRHERLLQIITPRQLEKLKEIWRRDATKN